MIAFKCNDCGRWISSIKCKYSWVGSKHQRDALLLEENSNEHEECLDLIKTGALKCCSKGFEVVKVSFSETSFTVSKTIGVSKEDFITKRTQIISDMLDNPDSCGIYPTTKCFEELDKLYDEIIANRINTGIFDLRLRNVEPGKRYIVGFAKNRDKGIILAREKNARPQYLVGTHFSSEQYPKNNSLKDGKPCWIKVNSVLFPEPENDKIKEGEATV